MDTENKIKEYVKAIYHLCQNDTEGHRYLREQLESYNLQVNSPSFPCICNSEDIKFLN
jgi:hypothetical protein